MRGRFALGASALAALAAVVFLLGHPGADQLAPAAPRPPPRREPPSPTFPPPPPPAPAPPDSAAPSPAPAPASPPSPGSSRFTARDERLARSAGLAPPGESTTVRLLQSYSAEELAVMARFERLTGTTGSAALLELIERRRAGASAPELVDEATRLFAGDPLARAATLGWMRTTATPARPPAAGPPALLPLRPGEPR